MEEPLPCPFCGEMPVVEDRRESCIQWRDSHIFPFVIRCENKRCLMQSVTTHNYVTRSDAIRAWNTRRYPQIEVVEAVQDPEVNKNGCYCKNCIFYDEAYSRYVRARCSHVGRFVKANDFCAFGTRRKGL